MQLELQTADKVMSAKILGLLRVIITVIDFDFVDLRLLEVEINHDFFDEFWVQVVVYSLGLS